MKVFFLKMKSINLSESSGISKKRKEKEELFKKLFDEYFIKLFYFSKKFVKSEEVAQDIVSEVFYITWKNVANIEEIKDIRSYLYTCTKNESIRFLKSEVNKNILVYKNNLFFSDSRGWICGCRAMAGGVVGL